MIAKASRRGFLRLLGASSLAAKQALDKEVAAVALGGDKPLAPYSLLAAAHGGEDDDFTANKAAQLHVVARYFNTVGIPEFAEKELRAQTQYVTVLDPDLAAKRSWSMSVKIQEQRERNYQRKVEAIGAQAAWFSGRAWFKRVTGKALDFW